VASRGRNAGSLVGAQRSRTGTRMCPPPQAASAGEKSRLFSRATARVGRYTHPAFPRHSHIHVQHRMPESLFPIFLS
jgi:hypothetical protein